MARWLLLTPRRRAGLPVLFVLLVALLGPGCSGRPAATAGPSLDPAAASAGPARPQTFTRWPQLLRVGLEVGVGEVDFAAADAYRVRGVPALARSVRLAGRIQARVRGDELVVTDALGRFTTDAREVRLEASAEGTWTIGGDRFDGHVLLRRNDDGSLTLINQLGIEQYLRGVVPWEIGRPGEEALEAVKAQAIAARTYTYAHLGHWADLGFDLYDDTRDQVYRGLSGTAAITDRAVRETAGEVVVADGRLIRAYYSSTSGGFTSTLTDVWSKEGASYLVGARDADDAGRSWCADSPHFRWTESWSARELGTVIRENLPAELGRGLEPWDIGVVERLEVVERDRSGRVQRLAVVTDRDRFEVWGDRIRWVLRPVHSRFSILRSTMFEVENLVRDGRLVGVVLRGGGFGHGVGLCQTGALGRARAGQDAETILRAYYRGVEVVDVRSIPPGPPAR